MEPQKKLLMIVNPRAGRSKPRGPLYDAAAALCDAGYLLRIHRTTAAGDAARIAAQEGGDYDTVVAVGGDGTLNEVISGIQTLKTPPAVGYLPQGSTNDFAASLEIPSDPVQAAEAIVRDQRRQLDIGRFGERIFVYVASFGAFTRTSYTASQDVKMLWATSAICWKASGIWIRCAPIRSASPLMGRRWTVNTCSVPLPTPPPSPV